MITCSIPALWTTAAVFVPCPDASVAPVPSLTSPDPRLLIKYSDNVHLIIHLF